ncbi:MAG: pirin family protein [Betaproteobacteria bacterium]|nr:pirin family protein [Betaproteobacteria bacterium]
MEKPMRRVTKTVKGMPATDGAGVKLKRVIGSPQMEMLDPFLMLDEFGSDDPESWIAGFPDHPHRGFETVSIMLDGRVRHGDSVGNKGVIEAGDVQWMTAGRGIVHTEMPERAQGRLRGFQLWVNLPGALKMTAPRYQDLPSARIALAHAEGVSLRIIAGEALGVKGPVDTLIPVRLLLAELGAQAKLELPVPKAHNCFGYVYAGALQSSGTTLAEGTLAVFEDGGGLSIQAGSQGAKVLLCDGMPIGEPVARYGPFVMNTREELMRAFQDYERGVLAS